MCKGVIFLIFVVVCCIIAPLVWYYVCNKSEARNVYFQPMPPQAIQPNYAHWIPQAYQHGTGSGENFQSHIVWLINITLDTGKWFFHIDFYHTISAGSPNQYSQQIISETQNPPLAGQNSIFGKLRSKFHDKSQNLEIVEPCLNPVQSTEGH